MREMATAAKKDTGGSAFPTGFDPPGDGLAEEGMSLRDYFAAKAMTEAIRHHLDVRASTIQPGAFDWDLVAVTAYKMADAMLKEREK